MLYELIGWSIFVGIAAVILMLPIHAKLAGYFQSFRAAKMKAMDSRLRLVNEVLGGMKIVKLYNCTFPSQPILLYMICRSVATLAQCVPNYSFLSNLSFFLLANAGMQGRNRSRRGSQ